MADLFDNPMGTDGFEFIEYTAPDAAAFGIHFETMGFRAVARHRSKDVTLYRQNDVNFIVNAESDSHGAGFAQAHGPSACAMAFRVKDAGKTLAMALEKGAKPVQGKVEPRALSIPAIARAEATVSRQPRLPQRQIVPPSWTTVWPISPAVPPAP